MTSKTISLFQENAAPTHCCRRTLTEIMTPAVQMSCNLKDQASQFRRLLLEAELAENNPAFQARVESMNQSILVMEACSNEILNIIRRANKAYEQLTRYIDDTQRAMEIAG